MDISIVVPCFNEQAAIPFFLAAVKPILEKTGMSHEIVFVDDGSRDKTVAVISGLIDSHPEIRLVELSRNFGKEAAMTAGFSYAAGRAIIPMDCDLQDPPELIPEMIGLWKEGYKVVQAVRRSRSTDTWAKRTTALFSGGRYRLRHLHPFPGQARKGLCHRHQSRFRGCGKQNPGRSGRGGAAYC